MLKLNPGDSKSFLSALKNLKEGDETTIGPFLPSCKGEMTTLKCIREKDQKYWEVQMVFLGIPVCGYVIHKNADLVDLEQI